MLECRSVATDPARPKTFIALTLRGLLALAALAVSACGQKGPLVLPKAAPAASAASVPSR